MKHEIEVIDEQELDSIETILARSEEVSMLFSHFRDLTRKSYIEDLDKSFNPLLHLIKTIELMKSSSNLKIDVNLESIKLPEKVLGNEKHFRFMIFKIL